MKSSTGSAPRDGLFALLAAAAVLALATGGCAISHTIDVPRSATEQNLATEAIDRALVQLDWPNFSGEKIYIALGTPGDAIDETYMRVAVGLEIAGRGGRVVSEYEEADLVVTLLIGAVGLDVGGRFMGVPAVSSTVIPLAIPELALYKSTRTEGFAKTDLAVVDREQGEIVHRSGPVQGKTWALRRTFFFVFRITHTDTSRLD